MTESTSEQDYGNKRTGWSLTTNAQPPHEYVRLAIHAAQESTCPSKRGVVAWSSFESPDNQVTVGYNSPPQGFECDGCCGSHCSRNAVHAEMRALLAPRQTGYDGKPKVLRYMLHVKVVAGLLVPSGPPSCPQCSKHMLEAGVKYMWLYHVTGWHCYPIDKFHNLSLHNG